ncbi:glycosyltransferase [Microbacterium protaetiae]|uniref:Glycosyltransferase n=1 Tax=Microbacterium protaetiae TaxID=2509458 RepID=A0A4P6EHC8_9MICO|nr:glycosyltransferase [Microbacterium protaetiae]QAY60599.1 glycosyltransferase [Microbacterium protaetiae]
MSVLLRVVLDQLITETDPDLAVASAELARALVQTAPSGCDVGAIVPTGRELDIAGLSEVRRLGMGRRELAAAWQLGVTAGVGGGLIHSPTLLAPLTRHDRVNEHDQTVVTLWDLLPWQHPEELSRSALAWHKGMLRRARKHADAIVVPTHAMVDRLEELAGLGSRTRVIAGAAATGFAVPTDSVGRRRTLAVPEAVIALVGDASPSAALSTGFSAIAASGTDLPVVVLDAQQGQEPAIVDLAEASGISGTRVRVRPEADSADRAAILDASVLLVAPSRRAAFPWRVLEAMKLSVPVIAVASPDHREVIVDGGAVVGDPQDGEEDAAALGEAIAQALGSGRSLDRLGVLAGDRGRAFSWHEAADRVWQLHADL